jgi:hypothetical protein
MLYLNCEKLDVPVNPQSIADLNQIPDDVKQEIESKFENLQQELINNKAEKIYSEIEQGFEPFKAAVNNLTQANTIDEAIQRHYNAREAQKEFLEKYADKIGVLETLVKDNNEPQTQSLEDITLTEEGINDFSIKQKFDVLTSSYSQYSDGLSAHENDFIPSLFAAAQARDNLSSNVDEANDIHENIQNLEKYIQDQIDNHQFDEAEDILNKADNLISTNLINYINALEDSIKAVNGSLFTAPQKYHSEIKSLIEPDSDAMTAHHLLQEILHGAPKTFSDLKEKLSLQMAHHNFKHAWQEIEEHYVEMHNDLSHQQSNKVKLPHNSLQSIQEKLEQLKSTEYYTTQDHQKEALQELNSLEQLAMDTIQKYNRVSDQSFKIIELYGNELRSLTSSQLGETLQLHDRLSSTHKQNCSALSSLEKALQQEFQTVSTDIQNKSLSRGKTQDANNISGTYSEPPHSDEYGIRDLVFVRI